MPGFTPRPCAAAAAARDTPEKMTVGERFHAPDDALECE